MSDDRFAACLRFTAQEEGGWANDSRDSGGATMLGVTIGTFRAWRRDPYATPAQLRAITPQEASAIYAANYWHPPRCQDMPAGLDLQTFDMGVTAGPRRAVILLQQALGVPADGWVGPATMAAIAKAGPGLISKVAVRQADFYRGLPTFPTFGRGWLARVSRRTAAALAAAGSPTPVPVHVTGDVPHPAVLVEATTADDLNARELARIQGANP